MKATKKTMRTSWMVVILALFLGMAAHTAAAQDNAEPASGSAAEEQEDQAADAILVLRSRVGFVACQKFLDRGRCRDRTRRSG